MVMTIIMPLVISGLILCSLFLFQCSGFTMQLFIIKSNNVQKCTSYSY